MKCAICNEETIGRDPVKWGPEFAHRTCVIAFDAGVDVERHRMLEMVKDDAYAMTFQSFGQYRSALIAELRSNIEVRGATPIGEASSAAASPVVLGTGGGKHGT